MVPTTCLDYANMMNNPTITFVTNAAIPSSRPVTQIASTRWNFWDFCGFWDFMVKPFVKEASRINTVRLRRAADCSDG